MSTAIPTHVVAVFGVVKKGTKYLIAQRSLTDDQAAGEWAFVGGKVETVDGFGIVEETLRREVHEETGIEISDTVEFISSQGFTRSSGHHVVSLLFICEWKTGEAKPLEDLEQVVWKTLEELEAMELPSYTRDIVTRLVQHIHKKSQKLVRDNIPELSAAKGKKWTFTSVEGAVFRKVLLEKLIEEAHEVTSAEDDHLLEELADVYDVLDAIKDECAINESKLLDTKEKKKRERGGFKKKMVLTSR
jgi:predicted house-cleaning noncanonical NTP pyrophosphatase (MazG superfamily)/8-oxo-dGTP pyrophosphatase MutT (NUDIX family)